MYEANISGAQVESLTRIWNSVNGITEVAPGILERDMRSVYDLGLGVQEVLAFLYGHKPGLSAFLAWIHEYSNQRVLDQNQQEDVLSAEDLAHWEQNGYVVIRQAVSLEEWTAANQAIWQFLDADPGNPESWYQPHPAKNGLMVVFTQHPALDRIRHSPRIRKAYEQLYGSTAIYRVVDKVSFNPPETEYYRFAGSPLHWDTSLVCPIPERYQGLLYLTDVSEDGGAFKCVPGFHNKLAEWIGNLPSGTNLREHALNTLKPIPVPGQAGDFIIWHQALPHGASPNHDPYPRLVQYLTYIPDEYEDHREWI